MTRTVPVAERPSVSWFYSYVAPDRRCRFAVPARISRKRARRHDAKVRRQAVRAAIIRNDVDRLDPHENHRHGISWDLW